MSKRFFVIIGAIALVATLVVLSQCASPTTPHSDTKAKTYLNLHDSVKYVGGQTCKGCHPAIYASFMQTGMGQSFGPPTKAKSSGAFEGKQLYDEYSNLYYQPYWKGDSLYLKEFRLDQGDTIYTRNEKVHYIVGSGQHTNSHITETNGYLHQMPFTYYTQKDTLNLPPGFEQGHNTRFSRALGMECISCHNAYPHHIEGSFNKFEKVTLGIDCERCHGPGAAHVAAKRRGELVDVTKEIDYSIVNPAKLPYEKQIDLCQRCHLQGNAILKDGKEWTDYKPGMGLNEVVNIFMPSLKDQEGEFVMAAHPDRLRQSECFVGSQNHETLSPMTCITCHNPHQSVKSTQMGYFNDKCASCHTQQSVAKCSDPQTTVNCIDCHMKKSGTVDIPHVSVTDHFIRVYRKEEALPTEQTYDGLICVTQKNPDHRLVARAYLNYYEKFQQKQLFLDSAQYYLGKNVEKDWLEEWTQYFFLVDDRAALRSMAGSFDLKQADAETLYRLSTGFKDGSESASKRTELLKAAVQKMPLHLAYRNELAIHLLTTGQLEAAKAEVHFVLKEFPKDETALNTYGFYHLLKGDVRSADRYFDQVLALNPDHENALLNKAKICLASNRIDDAREWLERALRAHPGSNAARLLMEQL